MRKWKEEITQEKFKQFTEEYTEDYGLSRSEKLLIYDFYTFVFERNNGLLQFGDEIDEM